MKTKFMMLCGMLLTLSMTACFNGAPSASSSRAASSSSRRSSSIRSSTSRPHVHSFTAGAKTGAFTPETCSCSLTAYRFDIADAAGWNDSDSKMNGKVEPNN
ncbi:MAG: hypothetical protein GX813_01380, partial [Erysipelotrichia bacterium]|nr:hypothetical protein [Erysipelotrichia bacterium]